MAAPRDYLLVETVDASVSVLVSKLVVPNGSLELSEAESAELSVATGDVVGPASAVNNRIAVFDGTTGKLIKDGGSTIAEIVAGSGGLVTSVFGRTGNVVAATNDYTWAQIDKTTSSLANITTRSAADLSSGTLLAARMPALTGDVTSTVNTVATTIANNAVTLAKMADMADASFLGRNTAGTGDPEVLSIATAKTMLGLTGTNSGDVTLAGQNYLTIAGQVITANAVNLGGTHVTGTLTVDKGGTGTATAFTLGSVVFAGASGVYSQDNANLYWDDGNNRLGVGTAAPLDPFHVLKTQNAGTIIRVDNASTGSAAWSAIQFYEGATLRGQISAANSGFTGATGGAGAFQVWNSQNTNLILATNSLERVRIQGDGRVGINTTPTVGYQLDVNGALRINGDIFNAAATANLYLKDTSTGWQSATTLVVTPQANNSIRTSNFTSGLIGWNWSAAGDAEANNLTLRGALRTTILLYNAVLATNGTQITAKSAAKLRSDVAVPSSPTYGTTTVTVDVLDQDGLSHAASQLFVVNDILYMKDGLAGLTWFKVSAVSDQTTFWRYTAIIMAGTNNITYRTGLGTLDYGQSGQGFITLTADQVNSPYIQMATHAATFSSSDASGTLVLTPRLRLGNLNGSYGYATNIYGFGTGQYGTAGQSWLTVDPTNGVRIGNNTTVLTQVDAAGNASFSGSITSSSGTIAGWSISSTQLSSGNVRVASGQNRPASGPYAWFGTGSTETFYGWELKDSGGRFVQALAGVSTNYPYISVFDATHTRLVIGGLNLAFESDGATASVGMKIWNAAGTKLVEFSDVQNIIAGWSISSTAITSGSGASTVALDATVTGGDDIRIYAGSATASSAPFRVTESGALTATSATITGSVTATSGAVGGWAIASTKISSTGIDLHSGASAGLAFGTTPPTSASAGTGIWLDRTGLYGLSGGVVQAKLNASDGKITAAAGNVILDSRGVNIQANIPAAGDDYTETSAVNFRDSTTLVSAVYHSVSTSKVASLLYLETVPLASNDSRIELSARAATSKAGRIKFSVSDNNGATVKTATLTTTSFDVQAKLVIGSDTFNMATTKTPASASATGTMGDWCWDTGFIYICTATNTWKRVAISTW